MAPCFWPPARAAIPRRCSECLTGALTSTTPMWTVSPPSTRLVLARYACCRQSLALPASLGHKCRLAASNCLPRNTCQMEAILIPLFTYLAHPSFSTQSSVRDEHTDVPPLSLVMDCFKAKQCCLCVQFTECRTIFSDKVSNLLLPGLLFHIPTVSGRSLIAELLQFRL